MAGSDTIKSHPREYNCQGPRKTIPNLLPVQVQFTDRHCERNNLAAVSYGLFQLQSKSYREQVLSQWDGDNGWHTGGLVGEITPEPRIDPEHVQEGIPAFGQRPMD